MHQGFEKLIARVIPLVFGVMGLAMVIFLWSAPFGEFGSPPLFFRIFGTLIAIVFMLVGFGGAILGNDPRAMVRRLGDRYGARPSSSPPAASKPGYECPNCHARLDQDADVSPQGDVKCTYCTRWFNVHTGA